MWIVLILITRTKGEMTDQFKHASDSQVRVGWVDAAFFKIII